MRYWPVGVGGGEAHAVVMPEGWLCGETARPRPFGMLFPAHPCPACAAARAIGALQRAGDCLVLASDAHDRETRLVRLVVRDAGGREQFDCRPGPTLVYLPPVPLCHDCGHAIEPMTTPVRCLHPECGAAHRCKIDAREASWWLADVQRELHLATLGGARQVAAVAQSGPVYRPQLWAHSELGRA